MKNIITFIKENINNELEELKKFVSKFDQSKLFSNNYDLSNIPKEFYNKLVELSGSKHPDNGNLLSVWRMIFSKVYIEPMVGEIIGDEYCEYSSIKVDRTEKWDIKYKDNILIDVKNTLSSYHNYSIKLKDIDFIRNKISSNDYENRYILFLDEEIKTYDYYSYVDKNKKTNFKLYMIRYDHLIDTIDNHKYKIKYSSDGKNNYMLIPEKDIKENPNTTINKK